MSSTTRRATLPSRPRLKSTVVAIPISADRIALRRGTNPVSDVVIQDRPGHPSLRLLRLLDGTKELEAVEREAARAGDSDEAQVRELVAALDAAGALEDAGPHGLGGLTEEEAVRYSRNLNCWSATVEDGRSAAEIQSALATRHALVVGVGGLGAAVAHALAMAGCGRLTLVDFDEVELQNLNRQCLYDTRDLGRPKVEAAAERLGAINPESRIDAHRARVVDAAAAARLVEELRPDAVVGGADRPTVAIDRWLTDATWTAGIPYVAGGVSGAIGRAWAKLPGHGGCFECDQLWLRDGAPVQYEVARYREAHDLIPATSALSFGVQIVAGLVGYDVLHHLVGLPLALAGRIVAVDFATFAVTSTERPRHPDCGFCA